MGGLVFRYVDSRCPNTVELSFEDGRVGHVNVIDAEGHCESHLAVSDAAMAFRAALRFANAYDSELVFAGDRSQWQAEWGELREGRAARCWTPPLRTAMAWSEPAGSTEV